MLWEMGFSLPQARKSNFQTESEKSKIQTCFSDAGIFPVQDSGNNISTSRDLDFKCQANTTFETRYKLGKADFPIAAGLGGVILSYIF